MRLEQKPDFLLNPEIDLNDTILSHCLEAQPSCRVLVVDDDELVRARLRAHLEKAQFHVEVAASGKEALQVLGDSPCQIVVSDWQMPDMDGLDLCRYVRHRHNERYVYVILLSVRGSKQDVLLGLAAGADDYVVKGAPTEELMARIAIGRRITHVETSLRATNRENRRLSVTDPLTGTHNLRYLTKHLPREVSRSKRYGHSLAMLSCDIDGFKQINDRYGHGAGDGVLQAFVERANNTLRQGSDWIARTGGDEFMIILPETGLVGAHQVADKLRHAFGKRPVATSAGQVEFGVSIGVTAIDAAHTLATQSIVEDLLATADRGMYAVKRSRKVNN
jgi:two-component system, cell cycle response regulator